MKAKLLCFIFVCFFGSCLCAQSAPEARDLLGKEWGIVIIDISLSPDLLERCLEAKPKKPGFIGFGSILFWLNSDGGFAAPRQHPAFTGAYESGNHGFEPVSFRAPVAFLPIADQKRVYTNLIEAAGLVDVHQTLSSNGLPVPAVNILLMVTANGERSSAVYHSLDPDRLPKQIVAALAAFRRNLPEQHGRFFDVLKVPILPKLPANEANKFAKCSVHDEWMAVEEVEIGYGFPASREDYWKAAQKLFPNAHHFLWGGCVVTSESPKSGKTLYCTECKAAEKKWVDENEVESGNK